jgi:hypothetical protein
LLRPLLAYLSQQRPRFDSWTVHVRYVVDEVTMGQVFSKHLAFPPVSIFPQIFRIHPFVCHRRDMIAANDVVLKHTKKKKRRVNVKLSLLTL